MQKISPPRPGRSAGLCGAAWGTPRPKLVCDNLKAGVTAACRYEPGVNRTYQSMKNDALPLIAEGEMVVTPLSGRPPRCP